MLLQTVFTKAIRDRWLGTAIAAVTLVLFMFYTMAVYTDIDLSIYTDLPAGIRELMGIPEGADAASLSYNVMLGFMGAVTLTGLAISMGSASIAGEERTGTLGLLLANRRSRTRVLVSKIGAMVLLTLTGAAVLLVASHVVPIVLDVEIGETHIDAMMLHLVVNALFYGFGAMAVGAWTGNRALASGVVRRRLDHLVLRRWAAAARGVVGRPGAAVSLVLLRRERAAGQRRQLATHRRAGRRLCRCSP